MPGPEVQLVPCFHSLAYVEREWQLVDLHRVANRRNGVEISSDRQGIWFGEPRHVGVRHRRIKMSAVATGAFGQRVHKLLIGPCANSCLRVGRDVGCDQTAERSFDAPASGEPVPRAWQGMTGAAIADVAQISATFDLREILRIGRRAGGSRDRCQANHDSRCVGSQVTHGREALDFSNTAIESHLPTNKQAQPRCRSDYSPRSGEMPLRLEQTDWAHPSSAGSG